jgi:hypothetical protein
MGRRTAPLALIGGVVALAILFVVLLIALLTRQPPGGMGELPDGSPSAPGTSVTAEPSATVGQSQVPPDTPQADATPIVAAPEGILPPGSEVVVLVDGLRIREEPSTEAALVEEVAAGQTLYVADDAAGLGPVSARGFDWYPVRYAAGYDAWPTPPSGTAEASVRGWIASGSDQGPFVELVPVACPSGDPDLATVGELTPWARLACFGDRTITVEGTYGCADCDGVVAGSFEPAWLAYPAAGHQLSPEGAWPHVVLDFHAPPDRAGDVPPAGSIIRVRVHLDDAAASDCRISHVRTGGEEVPDDRAAAELYCREQFVFEGAEILGSDPAFESG